MKRSTDRKIVIPYKELIEFSNNILLNFGVPEKETEIISNSIVHANLMGHHSHGIARLTDYIVRIEKGLAKKHTELTYIKNAPSVALIDANNGWGQVASETAVEVAVEKAKEAGSSWVGVYNSNHYGTSGYWTSKISSNGMIGISMTNTSPVMAPFGSREASLGTNPISIAIPTKSGKPVLLDMATSNQARGKITLAAKTGQIIPDDWAITKDGKRTTDPREALEGSLLPFGGAKGSGLALMVDILSGVLTNSAFGSDISQFYNGDSPQNLGHIFGAINIDAMLSLPDFLERMEERENQTRNSAPALGFEKVFMPGDIEHSNFQRQERDGIELDDKIFEELLETARRHGVKESFFDEVWLSRDKH
ncbi:Ldh family oxidoreductase [Alkalihalobacillus oceani]|uniref:Ldh family oxidoreductase n=1 Tax=Halalkalibacter oceani TaxID=1653776 RepID=UPI002040965A|nr:Ldh family oxidoreductase [Halalkalibacter oceani]MCM3761986.1 Ldh family oxidoreductase [Halalkalibacter oceani]